MNEKYRSLFSKSWDNYKSKVLAIVESEDKAIAAVNKLVNYSWREKVAASKIITVFNLEDEGKALIEMFFDRPSYYECIAYSNMAKELYGKQSITLLENMKGSLNDSDRHAVMIAKIDETLKELKDA